MGSAFSTASSARAARTRRRIETIREAGPGSPVVVSAQHDVRNVPSASTCRPRTSSTRHGRAPQIGLALAIDVEPDVHSGALPARAAVDAVGEAETFFIGIDGNARRSTIRPWGVLRRRSGRHALGSHAASTASQSSGPSRHAPHSPCWLVNRRPIRTRPSSPRGRQSAFASGVVRLTAWWRRAIAHPRDDRLGRRTAVDFASSDHPIVSCRVNLRRSRPHGNDRLSVAARAGYSTRRASRRSPVRRRAGKRNPLRARLPAGTAGACPRSGRARPGVRPAGRGRGRSTGGFPSRSSAACRPSSTADRPAPGRSSASFPQRGAPEASATAARASRPSRRRRAPRAARDVGARPGDPRRRQRAQPRPRPPSR